jgi:hypothetical protein
MNVQKEYSRWFESLPLHELSFGYAGLRLFSLAELDEGQLGYSRSPERESLCSGEPGSWKNEWIVIGNDTLLGDTLILDTSSPNLRVLTDMHGQGSWNPRIIATSLESFAFSINTIHQLSAGREDPAKLEQNPLSEEDRQQALNAIRAKNGDEIDPDFWSLFLEPDEV